MNTLRIIAFCLALSVAVELVLEELRLRQASFHPKRRWAGMGGDWDEEDSDIDIPPGEV